MRVAPRIEPLLPALDAGRRLTSVPSGSDLAAGVSLAPLGARVWLRSPHGSQWAACWVAASMPCARTTGNGSWSRHRVRRLGVPRPPDRQAPGGRRRRCARRGSSPRARGIPPRGRQARADHRDTRRRLERGVGRPGAGGFRRGNQHRRALRRARQGDLRGDPWAGRHARRPGSGIGGRPTARAHLGHRCRSHLRLALCPCPSHRRTPGQGAVSRSHHPPPERHVRARRHVPQPAGGHGARDARLAAVRQRRNEVAAGLCRRRRRSGCKGPDRTFGEGPSLRTRRSSGLPLQGPRATRARTHRPQTVADAGSFPNMGTSGHLAGPPFRSARSRATRSS